MDDARFKTTTFFWRPLYRAESPPRKPIGHLQDLLDANQEIGPRLRARSGWIVSLSLFMFLPLLCLNTKYPELQVAFWFGLIVCLGGLIAGLAVFIYWEAFKLDEDRLRAARSLLLMLAKDMDPATPIKTRFDLRSPTKSSKHKGRGEANGWQVEYYEDPWLLLQGRFLDGTRFRLRLTEKHQARTKTKYGRRGRLKVKTKAKRAALIALDLKIKTKRYGELTGRESLFEKAIKPTMGFALKSSRLKGDQMSLALCSEKHERLAHELLLAGCAAAFLSCYQALNAFKQMEEAAPDSDEAAQNL